MSRVVITEAGFGADVGGEKFFDIKTRASGGFLPYFSHSLASFFCSN